MTRFSLSFGLVAASFVALGCGSSGDGASPAGSGGGTDGSGYTPLDPPPAGQGRQFRMESTLAPGQEIERCQLIDLGAEGFAFNRSEVRYAPGSHHVLLYETPYTTMPTKTEEGVALDPTQVHDCANGATAAWNVNRVVSGSQNFQGDAVLQDLPEGIGFKVQPHTILLMNTHYLNTAPTSVTTDARINVWTVPESSITSEAGVMFFYNPIIAVRAHAKSQAWMRCPVTQDIQLLNMQSHMHRRGVGYTATWGDAANPKANLLYTNTKWEEVPVQHYSPAQPFSKGQVLEYHCEYDNPEDHDIFQGFSTRDEMCMMIGPYWPRSDTFENCENDDGSFAGVWTGQGSADPQTTVACMQAAGQLSGSDRDHAFFQCVTDACPGTSEAMSALVRCYVAANAANGCTAEGAAYLAAKCN